MKAKDEKVLLELIKQYDVIREKHSKLSDEKNELSENIKKLIGNRTAVDCEGYSVTYAYDKDKEISKFDEETFAKKEPKLYKQYTEFTAKYTKTETVKGYRRLVITASK